MRGSVHAEYIQSNLVVCCAPIFDAILLSKLKKLFCEIFMLGTQAIWACTIAQIWQWNVHIGKISSQFEYRIQTNSKACIWTSQYPLPLPRTNLDTRFDRCQTTEACPWPHIRETTTTYKYGDSMMRIRGDILPYMSPTSWWCLVDTSRRGWCWWVWRLISWSSDLANRPMSSLLLLDVDEECKWNGERGRLVGWLPRYRLPVKGHFAMVVSCFF
jgi:hypothetical protein